jgi:hypothetical protein
MALRLTPRAPSLSNHPTRSGIWVPAFAWMSGSDQVPHFSAYAMTWSPIGVSMKWWPPVMMTTYCLPPTS